jgi:hypothetical protein
MRDIELNYRRSSPERVAPRSFDLRTQAAKAEVQPELIQQAKPTKNPKRHMHFGLLILMIFSLGLSLVFPALDGKMPDKRYELNDTTKQLIGTAPKTIIDKFNHSAKEEAFVYEYEEATENSQKVSAGQYATRLEENIKEGITITDPGSQVTLKLTPQFKAAKGKKQEGSVVYPIYGSGAQLVYTLKANGVKEDIIIPEFTKDSLEYGFDFDLPAGVEARLESDGSIGIYGGDSSLFGNISYGSDQDREAIEKARIKSAKTNLLFTIPAPIVKQAQGEDKTTAKFALEPRECPKIKVDKNAPDFIKLQDAAKSCYSLGLRAYELKDLSYPLSIDPSVIVTATSDFTSGNFEGGVEESSGSIRRSSLTGGVLGSWTTDNSTGRGGQGTTMVVYNGFLYSLRNNSTIFYAPIAADGSITGTGAMTDSGVAPSGGFAQGHPVAVYNGYIYTAAAEGNNANNVQYAKINADGTLNAFVATTSFSQVRGHMPMTAYNGYLYISGGYFQTGCPLTCTDNYLADTQYAKIKADGSLEAWATTGGSFATPRQDHAVAIHNGYYYVIGGNNGSSTQSVQFTKVNSDGTLDSSWRTGSNLIAAGNGLAISFAANGYMYVIPGSTGSSAVQYAPIYADGSLGTWVATTAFTTARNGPGAAFYNGFIYVGGGDNGGVLSDIQYAQIQATPGNIATTSWNLDGGTSFTTARSSNATVIYHGYIYVSGGCGQGACGQTDDLFQDVQYAPINADGSIGTWASTSSFTTGRHSHGMVAYNGWMYLTGGFREVLGNDNTVQIAQINNNGTLGAWSTSANTFTTARAAHGTVAYNGFLYIMGGQQTDGTSLSSTQRAAINTDGTIGTFSSTTTVLNQVRSRFLSFVHNGFLYVVGGCDSFSGGDCTNTRNDIRYIAIQSNGDLTGSWTTNSNNLSNAAQEMSGGVHNGYLYVVGGRISGGAAQTSVQKAKVSDDGSIGTFSTTVALSDARFAHGGEFHNGYVYIAGGSKAGTVTTDVNYALINNGGPGSISSWTGDAGGDFSTARVFHTNVVYNGYIYVIGGCSTLDCTTPGTDTLTSVQYAPLNSDGAVGAWAATTQSLPAARRSHGSVAYNGYVYVIGGVDNTNTKSATVYYAPLGSNGNITTAWSTTNSLNLPNFEFSTAQYNGYIYVAGGNNSVDGNTTKTEYAQITSNGTLSAWTVDVGGNFTTARLHHASVAYNGYLYIMGGDNGAGCTASASFQDVQYAPLNADGSVGTWSNSHSLVHATTLTTQGAVAYNGYVYLTSGCHGGGYEWGMQRAPIAANGKLGQWQLIASTMDSDRYAAVINNGYLYATGGNRTGFPVSSTTSYAAIQLIDRRGSYSRTFDIGADGLTNKMWTVGSKAGGGKISCSYKIGTNSSPAFGTQQSINSLSLNTSNSLTYTGGATGEGRYAHLFFTFDDSQGATFPDENSTRATLDELIVYWRASSGRRLKGGRTLIDGALQSYDAQPQ